MFVSERIVPWWDREIDSTGRPIRADVRLTANTVWGKACKRARVHLLDDAEAVEVMEDTVGQLSRYLDRHSVVLFSRDIAALMMVAFQRALYRRLAKLRRVETLGGVGELSNRAVDRTWTRQVHAHLELEQIIHLLAERSRTVLALRYAGYTWKESAKLLGISVSALRSAFWRDVTRVKSELKNRHSVGPERPAQQDLTPDNPRR